MNRSFYARHAWPILIAAVALVPPGAWGTLQAFRGSNNNVSQWLPRDFPETEAYRYFCRKFGADEFAVVCWDDCTLDDPRVEELARRLVPPPEKRREGDGTEFFEKVLTGPGALKALMGPPFELSRDEAIERLKGTLVGPDGDRTCAVVMLSEVGDADRCKALDALIAIAVDQCELDRDELHLGGDTVFNAAIDIESQRTIRRWIGLSMVLALVIAWVCLRQIKLLIMVFAVSVLSAVVGTALIHYTGGQMNLVMVMVPVLIYVLTLSASVHLCNYYRDALRETGPAGAPLSAVMVGWTPCSLAAATTAVGLGSLYVSHIVPVKMFGYYSALGVIVALGLLFSVLPAMMEVWPLAKGSAPFKPSATAMRRDRILRTLAGLVVHHRWPVALFCTAVLVFCGCGVAFIKTSVRPSKFFDPNSPWIQDFRWLEREIGPMVSIEVVLDIDKESGMTLLDQMLLVDQIERAIRGLDHVGATISAATYAPSLNDVRKGATAKVLFMGDLRAMRRRILDKRLNGHRHVFVENRYLSENAKQMLWRITARVGGSQQLDYDDVLEDVEDEVRRKFPKGVDGQDLDITYTGSAPLVFVAQRELLYGLFKSFCLAFALIAVVMMILLRRASAGIIAMLPNVFPAVVTFGLMGWMAQAVDVGAMMTASVAMGIAVDDTLHFLTWFRRSLLAGRTRRLAIIEAFQRCAPAMTQTTLIAGLAILVFVRSDFQPVSQFGLLMFVLLAAALVGDLVFLPALLATRAGESFVRR